MCVNTGTFRVYSHLFKALESFDIQNKPVAVSALKASSLHVNEVSASWSESELKPVVMKQEKDLVFHRMGREGLFLALSQQPEVITHNKQAQPTC